MLVWVVGATPGADVRAVIALPRRLHSTTAPSTISRQERAFRACSVGSLAGGVQEPGAQSAECIAG